MIPSFGICEKIGAGPESKHGHGYDIIAAGAILGIEPMAMPGFHVTMAVCARVIGANDKE